jgi:hypothetical protein
MIGEISGKNIFRATVTLRRLSPTPGVEPGPVLYQRSNPA